MAETSVSLLDRLRYQPAETDWQRLVEMYTPLIQGWLRQQARNLHDVDDVVQEVLTVVVRRISEFEHERPGSFRRWLKSITINCLRDHWKRLRNKPVGTGDSDFLNMLHQLEDPHSELSRMWEEEHDRHITQRLLQLIRPRFEAKTWRAFERIAFDGASPDETATELGISVNAVFIAKSRVLTALRQEGRGLLD